MLLMESAQRVLICHAACWVMMVVTVTVNDGKGGGGLSTSVSYIVSTVEFAQVASSNCGSVFPF